MDGSLNFSGTLVGSIAGGDENIIRDVQTNASGDYESVVDEQGDAKIDLSNYTTDEQLENAIDNVNSVLLTKLTIVNYSTEEQNTGIKWIDGKYIFQKTFILENQIIVSPSSWTNTEIQLLNVDKFINAFAISEDGTFQGSVATDKSENIIQLQSTRNSNAYIKYLTTLYTKIN